MKCMAMLQDELLIGELFCINVVWTLKMNKTDEIELF